MGTGKIVTLVLSGGGDPENNNYSQYLQAVRLGIHLSALPDVETTMMFGSGLRPESPPNLPPDVVKGEGNDKNFIRGEIPNNLPATLSQVYQYFSGSLAARQWNPEDRFVLIVADHGGPNKWDLTDKHVTDEKKVENSFNNNCITLWTPESLLYPEKRCLSVGELRYALEQTIPPEVPKTFVMSQCYSGAFHLLGYSKDADGKPHREGNICGFTASTSDTTSAGCTAFVEEGRYDGYERRMAEQLTGLSVITGSKFSQPVRQLSAAHDEALLKDNTKDVPLRTSESYVLDYYSFMVNKKSEKNGEAEGADEFSLQDFLDAFWEEINKASRWGGKIDDDILSKDMMRRLDLVMRLQEQIEAWFPGYKGEIVRANLESIMTKRKTIIFRRGLLKEQLEKFKKLFQEKWEPVEAQFRIFLGQQRGAYSLEEMEFERLLVFEQSSEVIFARLSREDPTLKKLERFRVYEDERKFNILHWAQRQPKLFKPKEIQELIQMRANIRAMRDEEWELETLEGQLRRLETQMIVAGTIAWMGKNHQGFALEDIKNLVMCESNARL